MENKFIQFEIDSADIIDDGPDSQFAIARIQAFSSGTNKHDMVCDVEVLKETAPTINEVPILYNFDSRMFGRSDFGTHTDPEKSLIAGYVVPNSYEFVELDDSRIGLTVLARIWKFYVPQVVKLFSQDSEHRKSVSVEMSLIDSKKRSDGLVEMLDFIYRGICLLGDLISPASPGAYAEIVSFAEENQKIKTAYELEFGRYDDVNFKIPAKVKKNASLALETYKRKGKGATSNSLATCRHLINNESASPEKVKAIAKRKLKGDESDLYYGGSDGSRWASEVAKKLEELDNKSISFFSGGQTIEESDKKEESIVSDIEKKEFEEETPKEEEVKPEDEKKEDMAEEPSEKPEDEEKEEEKEEEMAVDYSVFAEMFAEEENYAEVKEEFSKPFAEMNYAKLMSAMFAKMGVMKEFCNKMAAEKEEMAAKFAEEEKKSQAYMAENEELKKFKFEKDQEQFNFAVDSVLKEIEEKVKIPTDELDSLREKSAEFSLDTLENWRNLAKSRALDFAMRDGKETTVSRYGLPFQVDQTKKSNGSPWPGR